MQNCAAKSARKRIDAADVTASLMGVLNRTAITMKSGNIVNVYRGTLIIKEVPTESSHDSTIHVR